MITYEDIKNNDEVRTYIEQGDLHLGVLGFTEHAFVHAEHVANTAASILSSLHYSEREVEMARIAGFLHDIGNLVNRIEHAQTGAVIAFNILTRLGMAPSDISPIVSAIGNHDEGTGSPVNPPSAALMIADKSDVRRGRVRNKELVTFDIHDRVNYAVEEATLNIEEKTRLITLSLTIDTEISSKMEYFEIFLSRMVMCRKAAHFLDASFALYMNNAKLL